MSYVAQAQKPNPAAIIGALGVPAAFGALLVVGLAISVTIKEEDRGLEGVFVKTPPPPLPTPTPTQDPIEVPKTDPSQSVITKPNLPFEFDDTPVAPERPMPPTDPLPPGPTPGTGNGLGSGSGTPVKPTPTPTPKLFDPISAAPRGNPGSWITTSDYRSSWIRREMQGSASFNLQVNASGRVTGCTITSSTGHSALDEATCSLLQKRARFEPARDTTGAKVAGTYRSSITWRLPE